MKRNSHLGNFLSCISSIYRLWKQFLSEKRQTDGWSPFLLELLVTQVVVWAPKVLCQIVVSSCHAESRHCENIVFRSFWNLIYGVFQLCVFCSDLHILPMNIICFLVCITVAGLLYSVWRAMLEFLCLLSKSICIFTHSRDATI